MPKMLNIGCGSSYHKDWINIDKNSSAGMVLKYDLRKGLPFPDNSFDVTYSSHLLEHLTKEEAQAFLAEQKRVLKNQGIIRIVVPDLEKISRNYIKYLDELTAGNFKNEFRYKYTILELFDQMTRENSGGELGKLWKEGEIADSEFVLERHGKEVYDLIQSRMNNRDLSNKTNGQDNIQHSKNFKNVYYSAKFKIMDKIISIILGKERVKYLKDGTFRNGGEIHKVMYDRYSLKKLLLNCGFSEIRQCSAFESSIADFNSFELDVVGGFIRKPDSIYMEATVKKIQNDGDE